MLGIVVSSMIDICQLKFSIDYNARLNLNVLLTDDTDNPEKHLTS
jgi:hypothetical protein